MTDSRRALVLGLGVAGAYLVLAAVSGRLSPFASRPILDGFAPPPPYHWVSPPPDLASTNKPPSAGRFTLSLDPTTGSKADVFSTADGQVSLALGEGAVPSRPGQDSVALTITPMAPLCRGISRSRGTCTGSRPSTNRAGSPWCGSGVRPGW